MPLEDLVAAAVLAAWSCLHICPDKTFQTWLPVIAQE
jgi:hypothetical protein